jgi:acetate CoA/acetoacetate CoA-transferase alpha subunit
MKTAISVDDAIAMIPDGATVMMGGFMGVGAPDRLVRALAKAGRRDLTLISNDGARPPAGPSPLIEAGCVRRLIVSHIGLNKEAQARMLDGRMEVELVPQGTLVERIRAAGVGLGGVLTPTGVGTAVQDGKPVIEVDGKPYLLEKPLRADFALIAAWRCDYLGNLAYDLTARNFNPVMALAADTVIVEPREIVPVGVIPPDEVQTPGALVDVIVGRAA